ncbi:MAG: MocR-like ectoine utilization transcription factor EhuR [Roseinatronobacter sp.]
MTQWLPDPRRLTRPVYRSLAQAITDAIATGDVRAGERLPTHRDLAHALGVSVQTVSRAYDMLIRAEVLSGEVGRGTFIRPAQGEIRAAPFQPLEAGDPILDCSILTPVSGAVHRQAMDAALSDLIGQIPHEVLFSFRPRQRLLRHAEAALPWLRLCGLDTRADLVLTTNGATSAMTVALMTAAPPGSVVATEAVSHHTLRALARYLGVKLAALDSDAEGLLPAALRAACETNEINALFLMPSGTNVLNRVMGPDRRAEILRIAQDHDLFIIENDAWGPLAPDRLPPMAALAPDRVFHVTSLTKCLLPGLRLGWLVVPESLVAAAFGRHLTTNWMATALIGEIGTRWIGDGTARQLLDWQRAALARRNQMAAERLAGLPIVQQPHGLHVWLPLPDMWDESRFVDAARAQGVAVAPGNAFHIATDRRPDAGVRICLGGLGESDLDSALSALSRLVRTTPEPDFLAI